MRDRRQAAYAEFLGAWDAALRELEQVEETWDAWTVVHAPDYPDINAMLAPVYPEEVLEGIQHSLNEHLEPTFNQVRVSLEHVQLLGPIKIDSASKGMCQGLNVLGRQLLEHVGREDWESWGRVRSDAYQQRRLFFDLAVKVIREAPSPARWWRRSQNDHVM